MANQNPGILIPPIGVCHERVRQAIQDIVRRLGTSSTPAWSSITLSDMTQGSVLFAGAGGLVSQDNTNLSWNDSTNILSTSTLTVAGTVTATRLLIGS